MAKSPAHEPCEQDHAERRKEGLNEGGELVSGGMPKVRVSKNEQAPDRETFGQAGFSELTIPGSTQLLERPPPR